MRSMAPVVVGASGCISAWHQTWKHSVSVSLRRVATNEARTFLLDGGTEEPSETCYPRHFLGKPGKRSRRRERHGLINEIISIGALHGGRLTRSMSTLANSGTCRASQPLITFGLVSRNCRPFLWNCFASDRMN
jgi:hypothetical protein